MKKSTKSYLAEFIGTAVLVIFGCGTAVVVGCDVKGGYLMTALAFGLVIVAMAYSIGNISGCHINPAVSLAMLITKNISLRDFIGYVISQVLGAVFGSLVLLLVFGKNCGFGANDVLMNKANTPLNPIVASLIVECILTFVFVFAILGVTSKSKNAQVSGLVIGLTLTLVHIIGIGLTGTSVNPARSLGPAIFAGGEPLKNVWIFILAPLAGAALAAFVWKALDTKAKNKD